jgi:hypothetical protein
MLTPRAMWAPMEQAIMAKKAKKAKKTAKKTAKKAKRK